MVHNSAAQSYWITTVIIRCQTLFHDVVCVLLKEQIKDFVQKDSQECEAEGSRGQADTPQLEQTHWNSQPGCSEVEACGNQRV